MEGVPFLRFLRALPRHVLLLIFKHIHDKEEIWKLRTALDPWIKDDKQIHTVFMRSWATYRIYQGDEIVLCSSQKVLVWIVLEFALAKQRFTFFGKNFETRYLIAIRDYGDTSVYEGRDRYRTLGIRRLDESEEQKKPTRRERYVLCTTLSILVELERMDCAKWLICHMCKSKKQVKKLNRSVFFSVCNRYRCLSTEEIKKIYLP